MKLKFITAAVMSASLALPGAALAASDYPNKPVRVIVPFPAGGAADNFARIVAEAEAGWPVKIALAHRIGALGIGDAAVAVAAGAAHREAAFAACRFVIEEVKRRVPIWKKEFYADGSIEWVGAGGVLVGDPPAGRAGP